MNMMTKVLIIEDEKPAQDHLERILKKVDSRVQILDKIDSVKTAVTWLQNHQADLIFMDIHLADGISFSIFDQVNIQTPIIFTTAYDAYAIQAFKVNSIDYLLKPIDEDDLIQSLQKFKNIQSKQQIPTELLLKALQNTNKIYQERFIVHRGERMMSVTVDQIAYFEGEDRYVYLVKKDGSKFIIDYRLSDLEELLDPTLFFRLNRSFIAHFDAIAYMLHVSKSRIKIELQPLAKRDIIISTENSQSFKKWLNQ